MKILFLTRLFYPHIGGVEKHAEEVSDALIKKGHQIMVLTLKHEPELPETENRGGIKIIRLPYSENKPFLWQQLWHHSELIKQADIVHCHDVFFWYFPFRFLFPRKPVFTTFHGWEGELPIPLRFKLARRIWEQLSWGNICVGDYLPKWYGTKPNYITYGACSFDSNGRDHQMNRECLFIGRLEKDLGIKEYLKAFKQIKKQLGFKITFIGDGSYRKQAEKIGPVTGFIKTIDPYLKKPAFVFCSSYLTILKAMANKRPVFALYQNGLKKDYLTMFPGAKHINIAGSAQELLKQFTLAVKKPTQFDKMLRAGQKYAQQQTWSKVTNLYLKLWQI